MASEGSAVSKKNTGVTGRQARHPRGSLVSKYVEPESLCRSNEITGDEADAVWDAALSTWGLVELTPDERSDLNQVAGRILAVSTSKAESNLDGRFRFRGVWYSIRAIHDAGSTIAPNTNDSYLRIFMRSFQHAMFACMAMDMAADNQNLELRQELSLRCGGAPLEDAPYMIDTADAVVRKSGRTFTAEALAKIVRYRNLRNDEATVRAKIVGNVTTAQDSTNREQSARQPERKVDPSSRTAFPNVNLR